MSKKIMLLALTVVSVALFALPAMATANELHVEGAAGKLFSGTGKGGNLTATGEPTIACTSTSAAGSSFSTDTTGTVNLTFTGCTATILGVPLSCRSTEPGFESGRIKVEQIFHLITIGTSGKPGVLLTPPFPTIVCGSGLSERKIQITGNGVIGTVTSPACGESSSSMTVEFKATEGHQEHKLFTGVEYDLTSVTEPDPGGASGTAGITGEATLTFTDEVSRKLVCT